MQQLLFPLPIQFAGQNQSSRIAQFRNPRLIPWSKLPFELLPKFLRQRRTLPRRRNRNLQIAAPYHSRIKEIAVLRNIHHIAKHTAPLSLAINQFVQTARSRCDDRKKRSIEVARRKSPQLQFNLSDARPLPNRRCRFDRNHPDLRTRINEPADLGLPDLARPHNQALPSGQFYKHWKQTIHRFASSLFLTSHVLDNSFLSAHAF